MSTSAIAIPLPSPSETWRRKRAGQADGPHLPHQTVAEMDRTTEPVAKRNPPPDRSPDAEDGLQQIKGIGPSIAQALHSLGIHHPAELIDLTPEGLAEMLRNQIPTMSAKRIVRDDWLAQARVLARRRRERKPSQPETEEPPAASAAARKKEAAQAPREEWLEGADFFVSYGSVVGPDGEKQLQTKAHHSQGDQLKQWDGIATDQLIHWMLQQADLLAEAAPGRPPVTGTQTAAYDAQIEILGVEMSLIGPSSCVPEKRLVADVHFKLAGPEAGRVTSSGIPSRIEVHTVDLESGASNLVASKLTTLQPGVLEYTIQQEFGIPDLGRYELHTIVLLLPPGEIMTFHRGPTLRVVP